MIKVLFVCLGNICRSPIAEGTFRELVKKYKLEDQIQCDSVGTTGWHAGELPDRRTIRNAIDHGIALTHRGRKITTADLDDFDHLIAMDETNFKDVNELYYKAKGKTPAPEKLFLLRDYDPETRGVKDVPDPYFSSESAFENVFQIVWRSNEALLQHLIDKHQLKPKTEEDNSIDEVEEDL